MSHTVGNPCFGKLYPLFTNCLKAAASGSQHPETQLRLNLGKWLGTEGLAVPRDFLHFTGSYHETILASVDGTSSFMLTLSQERQGTRYCWRIMMALGTSYLPTTVASFEIDQQATQSTNGLEVLTCAATIQTALAISVYHASTILLRRAEGAERLSSDVVFVALRNERETALLAIGA